MRSIKVVLAVLTLCTISMAIIRDVYTPKDSYEKYYNKNVNLIAKIENISDISKEYHNYVIYNIKVINGNCITKLKGKINLKTYKQNYSESKTFPEISDTILASGELKEPIKNGNSSNFFIKNYYNSIQVYGNMTISISNVKILRNPAFSIMRTGYIIKNQMELKYNSIPKRERELVKGIVFGDGELSSIDKDEFANAGISHIIAVSGFNLAIITYALMWVLKKIKIKSYISNLILIMTIWSFYVIAGGGISILRAAIMLTVLLLCSIFCIKYDNITVLCGALNIILLIFPENLFSLGFYLSFLATLGIFVFYPRIRAHMSFGNIIKNNISATIAAQILIIPILINCFNYISLISIIINLITAPLAEILTILGMLTAIMPIRISKIINYLNYILAKSILFVVDISCKNLKPIIVIESLPIILTILYYLLIFVMLTKNFKVKVTSMVLYCCILSIYYFYSFLLPSQLYVYAIDVGQGDSLLIKTPLRKYILIDGGGTPEYSKSTYDPGLKSVQPFLYSKGCNEINILVITHSHEDHVNGLLTIVNKFKIDNVIIAKYMPSSKNYIKLIKMLKNKHVNIKAVKQGDNFLVDKIKFDVLNPQKNDIFKDTHSDPNNDSVVLKLKYKKFKMLFTGDIEHEAENEILKLKTDLKCDVLKVGHHEHVIVKCLTHSNLSQPLYFLMSTPSITV